eukprot:TRINITY_DN5807_c0_g1_i1.p1 TRINITY_DN5807_c0_g1~~TRINITY_DN5807_c0_g1_i1.p1  ORF type:complete len:136 (-),score=31.06 TRINITY_DN5807_c0_g1_i1:183-590(-)
MESVDSQQNNINSELQSFLRVILNFNLAELKEKEKFLLTKLDSLNHSRSQVKRIRGGSALSPSVGQRAERDKIYSALTRTPFDIKLKEEEFKSFQDCITEKNKDPSSFVKLIQLTKSQLDELQKVSPFVINLLLD